MLRKALLVACVLCAAILVGCSKTEPANTNTATTPANSNKATTTTTTASTGDKIGIKECDDYIAKYEACTPKVPEAGRAAYKSALDQARTQWKKLAENPATKGSLAAACKQAADAQAAAWKTYGCGN
ncbi:MAG TPA: hypothetical protein VKD91_07155 [Pyrinomonadaceae bacterium]|nr:hypothetical protein [Pyrinomonadaceae bacterium]